jgi:hypothetical protein
VHARLNRLKVVFTGHRWAWNLRLLTAPQISVGRTLAGLTRGRRGIIGIFLGRSPTEPTTPIYFIRPCTKKRREVTQYTDSHYLKATGERLSNYGPYRAIIMVIDDL